MREVSIIKPCPFCGGRAFVAETFGQLHIDCEHDKKCLAAPGTWLRHGDMDIYEQIKLWNRRYKDGK